MWNIDFRNHSQTVGDFDSFSVCVMAREEGAVLQRFVDHYTRAGASRIFLYFDGTQDEAQAACQEFANNDLVTLQVCDKEFWGKMFPDQEKVLLVPKLICVFRRSIELNESDWILFCDADEFVTCDVFIGSVLAKVPADVPGVRIRNTEAVWGPSDNIHEPFGCGYERLNFKRMLNLKKITLVRLIYGSDLAGVLKRGMAGHNKGKQLLRKGVVPEEMRSHSSVVSGVKISFIDLIVEKTFGLHLIHFDAISFERWQEKWLARVKGRTIADKMSSPRLRQMNEIERSFENGTSQKLFRRYYGLNHRQKFMLTLMKSLSKLPNS